LVLDDVVAFFLAAKAAVHKQIEEPLERNAQSLAPLRWLVRRGERAAHRQQCLIGKPLDTPKRVLGGYKVFEVDLDKQVGLTAGGVLA